MSHYGRLRDFLPRPQVKPSILMYTLPVYSHRSENSLNDRHRSWPPGRHRHLVGWSANRMVLKSVLTIAGGAALWGLIVLATHFLWAPPKRGLLITPPQEMPNSVTLLEPVPTGLLEMCRGEGLLVLGKPRQLVQLRYDFVSKKQLQRLHEHLLVRWPPMTATELAAGYNALNINLNDDGWGRLQGACLRHGAADGGDPSSAACTAEETPLSALHDLAQLLRAPWANAWSLNVVYAQPRNVRRAGQSGPQDPHVDNLSLREGEHECSVASSETSVLYLQVPKDMQGGHLTIFEVKSGDNLVPSRHIQAEQNLLVRFRGSAPHRVEEFVSSSVRISITLEQYQLPAVLYRLAPQFQVKRIQY